MVGSSRFLVDWIDRVCVPSWTVYCLAHFCLFSSIFFSFVMTRNAFFRSFSFLLLFYWFCAWGGLDSSVFFLFGFSG
jgi:hypothetical protein